jgi:hypothetical protein
MAANISTDSSTWSATASSNQPDTTDSAAIVEDLQAIQAGVKNAITTVKTSTTTTILVATDAGKCVSISAGITVPASIFAAGNAVSIYNNSSSNQTITQGSGLTLRQVGTSNTGDRTLSQRGLATIWFVSATEAVITGGVLS